MTSLVRAAFVCLALAGPSLAQDAASDAADGTASDPTTADREAAAAAPGLGVVATVNGTAITVTDVTLRMAELRRGVDLGDVPDQEIAVEARRMLAEEILLAAEAVRRGLTMSERQVVEYWTRKLGRRPDFEEIAERTGTTVQRQKELARRAALAEQFVELRTSPGLAQGSPVPPDPALVRLMTITPEELREEFRDNADSYDLPERIVVAAHVTRDVESAETARDDLLHDRQPSRGVRSQREMHPTADIDRAFSPEMALFLKTASPGEYSHVFALEGAAVFLELEERLPPKQADFAEVQNMLRQQLEMARRREARSILVRELTMEAAYWPPEVF